MGVFGSSWVETKKAQRSFCDLATVELTKFLLPVTIYHSPDLRPPRFTGATRRIMDFEVLFPPLPPLSFTTIASLSIQTRRLDRKYVPV